VLLFLFGGPSNQQDRGEGIVRGTLTFVADDGSTDEYSGQIEAIVWNMRGMDFILGLPDITRNFVDLLTSMLRVTTNEVSSVELETDMKTGEIIEWSTGEVEESPEEEETPLPVAFGPVLAFMEMELTKPVRSTSLC